jgi:hypothetical protein
VFAVGPDVCGVGWKGIICGCVHRLPR